MADIYEHLVKYEDYCKKCKNKNVSAYEDPCNECLTEPARTDGSRKPIKFEEE